MERKRAMAVAATVTCVLGSSTVALAATAGVPVLGFGRSPAADAAEVATVWHSSTARHARRVVTRTKNVVDKVVVDVPEGGGASATAPDTTTAQPPVTEPREPLATSTATPITTTTRPPGVSADWPGDRRIRPAPPDCHDPQVEDNGLWNCHDD